jgi:DICT domain-containing protein
MPDVFPARAGVLSKRALVTASHAVEHAALAGGAGADTVVFALFQRLPYFEREREVYARIARAAAVTVVGVADPVRPDLPHGVTPVLLHPGEALAREWSVVVLSPAFGAAVVARDLGEVDPRGTSVEAARLFRGRWGLRRDEAYAEVVRLRDALGDRLPPAVRRKVGEVLAAVAAPAAVEVESRAEAALRHVAARLAEARATAGRPVDPETGLDTPAGLAAWLGEATDTVPLGLVLVTVDDPAAVERRHGGRIRMHTEQNVADLLRAGLRPLDRAVRLGPGEFLVVQPAGGGGRADRPRPPPRAASGGAARDVPVRRPAPPHDDDADPPPPAAPAGPARPAAPDPGGDAVAAEPGLVAAGAARPGPAQRRGRP